MGEYECTCELEHIEPHKCPYSSEIEGDDRECTCCPYCTQSCEGDI